MTDHTKMEIELPAIFAEGQTLAILGLARALVVESLDMGAAAAALRADAKAGRAAVVDLYKKPKQSLDAAKRTLLDAEKRDVAPYDEAIAIIDERLVVWRRAEVAKLEEVNRLARAEAERARAKAVAEEDERRQAAALALEAAGLQDAAEAMIDAPIVVPVVATVAAAASPPKVAGIAMRTTWDAEVDSVVDLVKWALEQYRLDLVTPNLVALRKMATDAKREDAAPPGVRFVKHESVASR